MIGLVKGLFSSKSKVTVEVEQVEMPAPMQKPQAFYLSADDAKTFGNIEYMRTAKTVRRSFPKEKLGKDNEYVQTISAMEKISKELSLGSSAASEVKLVSQTDAEIAQRRQADTSMDMFRNMARDMRKR